MFSVVLCHVHTTVHAWNSEDDGIHHPPLELQRLNLGKDPIPLSSHQPIVYFETW